MLTRNYKQTENLGKIFAKKILKLPKQKSAVVLGLSGNLGGGKTTFLQGFAKGLGIKEKVLSPTFVIIKKFSAQGGPASGWKNFYHFDCYRINRPEEILELFNFSAQGGPASGWKEIIENPKNIVAIEWPEKIKKILPKNIIFINFKFKDKTKREIKFKV